MEKEHWGYKEVGYKYRTEPRFITPAELDLFVAATGMRGEIFLSDDAAKAWGAKGRIVPGPMLIAFVLASLRPTGLVEGGLFIGTNNVRFNAPVHPFDRLVVEGELLNKRVTSKGDRVIVTYSWLIKNEDGVVVAQGENTCIFPNPSM